MANLRKRALAMNGAIRWEPAQPGGTRVLVELALPTPSPDDEHPSDQSPAG